VNQDHQPAEPTDEELLRRHLDGDDKAFEALVRRHQQELFHFLARFTGDAALADDVFQEAMLQLHISAAAFDPARRLKPWLFTIAANKARDHLRSRLRRAAAPLDAAIAGNEDDASYADLMPADVPGPDEFLMNNETRSAVQNIVTRLPDNLRLVLILCYFHDLAYKDIAEMLRVPLGTVKSRLHAAVGRFAKLWKAQAKRNHDQTRKT